MGLLSWLKRRQQKRVWNNWAEQESTRLSLLEQKTLVTTAKINLKISKIQLLLLENEEKRLKNRSKYLV